MKKNFTHLDQDGKEVVSMDHNKQGSHKPVAKSPMAMSAVILLQKQWNGNISGDRGRASISRPKATFSREIIMCHSIENIISIVFHFICNTVWL